MTISFPDNSTARESVHRYIAALTQTFARVVETTSDWTDAVADHANRGAACLSSACNTKATCNNEQRARSGRPDPLSQRARDTEPPTCCSASGSYDRAIDIEVCGRFITISGEDGYAAASNGPHCPSAGIAGFPPMISPTSRSSRCLDRAVRIRRLVRRTSQYPPGCRARTRMAPRGSPFTDGGAVISLVISHCLTDGVGLCEALADAAGGRDDVITWPAAVSRPRWRALREDARQTARDIPAIGRAVVAMARTIGPRHRDQCRIRYPATQEARSPAEPDEPVTLPTTTIFVDADEWDARAQCPGWDQQRAARRIGGPPRPADGAGRRRRLSHRGDAR